MKPSLRANLTWNMTALFTTALAGIGILAFLSARSTVANLADEIIHQASVSIDDKVQGLLNHAESSGKLLTGLAAPTTTDPAATSSAAFKSIANRMLEFMASNREYSSVSYTLDRTGETVKAVQKSSGELVIQMTLLGGGNRRVRQDLVQFGNELRISDQINDWQSDYRQSVWFKQVRETNRPSWTETYLIPDIASAFTPGVTYAHPVYNRKNEFIGVVTVDITIADLSRFIDRIEVGRYGYAALLEFDPSGNVKVIAHPQKNLLVISENGKEKLADIKDLGDPVMVALSRLLLGGKVSSDESRRQVVKTSQRDYQVGIQRIKGDRRPDWYLAVVMPDDEFMDGVWRAGGFLIALGLVAIVAVWGLSFALSQRVAKPLQDLAIETQRVQALDLAPRNMIVSNVKEIDELGTAMEQMKTGLRSLEKLVPSDYARHLIASGQEAKLGGERRLITTYFADIIGFTALSERMEPEELVDVLTEYLDVLSGEVLRLGGTVDKYNGDDVMAFWGAPNHAEDQALLACQAAIASQATLEHLHTEWRDDARPLLRASFGISTGDVIVGNVGSRQRMNYTVIGDAVNLASRLQGLNKFYSTEILVSQETVLQAGDDIVTRLIDWVVVAGRDEPIPVFELLALTASADRAELDIAKNHTEGMRLYRERQFQEAMVKFGRVLEIRPGDEPSSILMARCEHYLIDPPSEHWNRATQHRMK